jgi:7,8-dihydropterin-6-yl-methyl-4-(beta-D-ribofuranosyl)aminobenzene 5'-phosphate synthase
VVKVTITYDNEVCRPGLLSDWGFSCLIEMENGIRLLFDTGADGYILLHNMAVLDIEPASIDLIFISHPHYDHTGGFAAISRLNKRAKVFVPDSCSRAITTKEIYKIVQPTQISDGIFSTGELRNIEQSLVVSTDKGMVVIVGCSHPGLGQILDRASEFGEVYAVIGGFHGFRSFQLLTDLSLICPCHCTQYKDRIRALFPGKCIGCGAGREIKI